MLIELRIQNYAVIERLTLRLDAGLNVLTGETGAGKSIIVGALSLLLGERASTEVVRSGAERASVEGVFDVAGRAEVAVVLAEQGIELEDELLILRREIALEGRNRAWVNGSASTVTFVGGVGRMLVDLHGQHESQNLLRHDEQRRILDAFGGSEEQAALVEKSFVTVQELHEQIDDLDRRTREVEQRADYLRFICAEIDGAHLREGEEERLAEEAQRLGHAEELTRLAQQLDVALYSGEESVSSRLGELRRTLDHLVRIDASQEDARDLLETALVAVEELGRRMEDYASSVEQDPARLEAIRTRQDVIFRMKAKYGGTVRGALDTAARARTELDLLDDSAVERTRLERAAAAVGDELTRVANALSAARTSAAGKLSSTVSAILPDVGLGGGAFEVTLQTLSQVGAAGGESVEFRVALNAGFELRPLARVASGGELSRIMLALKTVLARIDQVPTLVFDEIDVGIGGRVAVQVGEKLRQVAEHHQVFVITHLAQIASRAEHQLLVEKVEQEGTTLTRVQELHEDDRVRELARMLGGDPESAVSLQHARELISTQRGG
jgi:DNA repair protein RecN (Recombination protein N)